MEDFSIGRTLLKEASDIIGTRQKIHGNTNDTFIMIALLWSAFLFDKLDEPIEPTEVGRMMALLKIARSKHGAFNMDDYVDATAYMAIDANLIVGDAMNME